MGDVNRRINITVKLFTGAFPERISLALSPDACVRDLMSRVQGKSFKSSSRKKSPLPLQDVAQEDLMLILNGRPIQNLQGYDTPLEDGDVLAVFPVMAGG